MEIHLKLIKSSFKPVLHDKISEIMLQVKKINEKFPKLIEFYKNMWA